MGLSHLPVCRRVNVRPRLHHPPEQVRPPAEGGVVEGGLPGGPVPAGAPEGGLHFWKLGNCTPKGIFACMITFS